MSTPEVHTLCIELARLALVRVSPEEIAKFGPRLTAVIGYLDRLRSVDVEGVPEFSLDPRASPLRADEPEAPLAFDLVTAQVPVMRNDFVAVPKFKDD